ncbi:LysM peptidoglycan-binding domain-containing protein [Variovorax sp. 770b2]|uniref:LysM peptidoglycan-binding domain-containing protein n=1 Tax=Variovorax sp. 770b2 TaxID=1566271 RepID=UPI0008EEEED5|nr:LysM peptidoglycan-binding domain-containing protein [Variovorax sp. 770b2]SFQ11319.1 YD repeat-containing protein [Variovorax sp. 770b2]
MVAIVSGNSLGLSLTSLATLGQRGTLGAAGQGRNGEQAFVNIATGNLVLQDFDDRLEGRGLDIGAVRTYNSQGLLNDDNGDNWRVGAFGQQILLTGTVATAGSTLTRTDRDGAQSVYSWDSARSLYVSTTGSGAFDTIAHDATAGRFVWTDGTTGLVERYESTGQGHLVSVSDPRGNTVSYAYNANGTVQSLTNANGEVTYFDYTGTNLTQIRTVAAGGATLTRVHYTYDASNRLASVTVDLSPEDNSVADNLKYVTTYTYDGTSKRIASVTQTDGTSLQFTYVQVGADYKVATVKDGAGNTTNYSYDTANRRTSVVDPQGRVSVYSYDASGQLLQIKGPTANGVAQTTDFAYNANGDVIRIVDGEGHAVDMEYDANGNQVLQRDAAGNTITRTYDVRNQLLTETAYLTPDLDGAGSFPFLQPTQPLTTRYVYEGTGRNLLRFVLSPEGRVTEYRYDSYGQRTSSLEYAAGTYNTAALGLTATPTETQMVNWVGGQDRTLSSRSDFVYDARGQVQQLTVFSKVDASGNGVADGSQSVTHYVYDRAGQLISTVSATDGSTQYTYDGLGRRLSAQDALNNTTVTSYDDAGNKTTVTMANGLVTTSAYDHNGRLVSVRQGSTAAPLLGQTTYVYYADESKPYLKIDATGVATGMLYDHEGRLSVEVSASGQMVEYIYNKSNQVTQTIVHANPAVGLIQALQDFATNGTPMELDDFRPAASALDQRSWRIYDNAGRLVRTVDAGGAVTDIQYDAASRVTATTRYSQPISIASLDTAPTLAATAPTANATSDRVTRSFYDGDGLLRATLDAEGYLSELRYDGEGRLISQTTYATATGAALRATGTLAQLIPAASSNDQTSYWLRDAQDRTVAEIDAEGYLAERVFDANGNVTQTVRYATRVNAAQLAQISVATTVASLRPSSTPEDRTTTVVYDKLNRISQQTNYEGTVTQYAYDSAGNLVGTTSAVGTSEVRTLNARYDIQGRLVGELSGVGSALLTGGQTQAQIDAIWAQYGLTHAYDAAGRRTSTTDAYGNKTLFFYDTSGHLTHTVNALGEVTEQQYNTLGQLSATIQYGTRIGLAGLAGGLVGSALTNAINAVRNSALDSRQTFTYAATGALSTSTDALGNTTQRTYNAFGEEIGRDQAIGDGRHLVQTQTVDRRGLVTGTVADASGVNAITSAVYDAFGRATRTVDANGNVRTQSYDRLGRTVVAVDPLNAQRSSSYDAFGRVLTQTDALGNTSTYTYNKALRSVSVTTPENITITTVHTRQGQTQQVVDGNGNTTSFSYDKNGNLLSSTTPLTTTSSAYDRSNRLIQTTDASGNVVAYTYDAANRLLLRIVDPNGLNLVTQYAYDAKGQQITVTDANGSITQMVYDLKGQLLRQVIDPSGLNLVTEYTYDARGKTLSVLSPGGTLIRYAYDNLGRRAEERVDPNGLNITRTYAYDANGNVVRDTDANGNVRRYAYDADDRLVFTVDALGNVSRSSYDAEGRIVKTEAFATPISLTGLPAAPTVAQILSRIVATPGQDGTEHRVLDKDGRLTATVNGLGEVVKYVYDANGKIVERVAYANRIALAGWTPGSTPNPVGDAAHDQRVRFVYDQLGRATYTVDGTGAVVQQSYDGNGNVVDRIAYATAIPVTTSATTAAIAAAVAAIANPARDAHERFVYDHANRLSWHADGAGAVTQQVYDNNGNLIKQIQYATAIAASASPSTVAANSGDRITDRVYDKANRQVFVIDGLGGLTWTGYDKNGNVTTQWTLAVHIAAPTATSKLTEAQVNAAAPVDYLGADRVERFAFDAANRMVIRVDSTGAVTEMQYDGVGNNTRTTQYANRIDFNGLNGNWDASYGDIRLLFGTDAADRTTTRTFDAGNRAIYSVDALGHVSKNSYDGLGRLTQTTAYALSIPASALGSSATIGAALVVHPDDRTNGFVYDAAGRLSSSTDALGFSESYSYNALGEKTSFTNKKGSVWTYDYDAAGRLTQETAPAVEMTAATTDGAGNLVVDAAHSGSANLVTRLAYDALGNLVARTEALGRPEQRTTRYEYDTLGHQVKVIYPEVGVYNPGADNLAVNGANGPANRSDVLKSLFTETRYDVFGNAVSNLDVAGNLSYKTYDVLGRVRYEVDALGFVTGYQHNVWGQVTQLSRFANVTTLTNGNPASLTTAQVSAAINAAGLDHGADRTLTTEYDRVGRVAKVIEPQTFVYDAGAPDTIKYFTAGKTTANVYNAFGDLTQVAELKNAQTQDWIRTNNYYDKRGQLIASVDAMGYLTTQAYDGAGNMAVHKEYATAIAGWSASTPSATIPGAPNSGDDRTTVYTFDRGGRKTAETRLSVEYSASANGTSGRADLVTGYEYDAVGNLTRTIDAAGGSTISLYDALGRVTYTAAPSTGNALLTAVTKFQRDAYGNVVVKTDTHVYKVSPDALTAPRTDMTPGQSLTPGQSIYSPNGRYTFTFQTDGNLVVYDRVDNLQAVWNSATSGSGADRFTFQADGNLVLYKGSQAVWNSGTFGQGGTHLVLQDDGNLALYTAGGTSPWYAGPDNNWQEIADRSTYTQYDRLGHATQSTDANRVSRYSSYDAQGHVAKEWQTVTNGDASSTLFRAYQYDKLGQQTHIIDPASTSQVSGSSVVTVGQAQAGLTDTAIAYNAFGEVTRKSVNGVAGEYFDYDNAGHVWRTNAGDGVDKVAFYNLQGKQTAQILSYGSTYENVDLKSFQHADELAWRDLRRTDTVYDALGHVVQTVGAEREEWDTGPRNSRLYTHAALGSSSQKVSDESGTVSWQGTNSVNVSWAPLHNLGSGDVKVVMEYATQTWTVGGGTDESGNPTGTPVTVAGGEIRSRTQILTNTAQGVDNVTLTWADDAAPNGGISKVTRLTIYKKDLYGNWQQISDQTSLGYGGQVIDIDTPDDPTATVQLQLRPAGSSGDSGWASFGLTNFGDAQRFNASGLPAGNYEYRALMTTAAGVTTVIGSGRIDLTSPPLASIGTPMGFYQPGVTGLGLFTWQSPGNDVEQVFRIRPAGSNGAWDTRTVSARGEGKDGVDVSIIAAGTYEYELLWIHAGDGVPYAHATGQIVSTGFKPPYWVPPVNLPVIPGVSIASVTVGNITGYDESGNPIYSGPTTTKPVIRWPAASNTVPAIPSGDTTFRYRLQGSSEWHTLAIGGNVGTDESGNPTGNHEVDISGLPPGNYEYQVLVTQTVLGVAVPAAQATGNLVVSPTGEGHNVPTLMPFPVPVTITPDDPANHIIGWTGSGPAYGPPVVIGTDANGQPIFGQGYGRDIIGNDESSGPIYGPVKAIPYYTYQLQQVTQTVPVQVAVGQDPVPARDESGNIITTPVYETRTGTQTVAVQVQVGTDPVYARDEAGNIVYETIYETQYRTRDVPVYGWVQVPRTEAYQVPVQGAPIILGYDEAGNPQYQRDMWGNVLYYTNYETHYRTVYDNVLVQTGWTQETYAVQVPVQRPVITGYQPRYETQYVQVPYTYQVQVGTTPVYQRDGAGNIIYETRYETQYQTQTTWVQVPTLVTPADPSQYIVSSHSGSPIYGPPVMVVTGHDESGNAITGLGKGYQLVNGVVTAVPYTEIHTEWRMVDVWVPGTTPAPTVTDTTPPYTPGFIVPAMPPLFAASVTTVQGSSTVSETGTSGAPGSQAIWLSGNGGSPRPVVNQNTDRWGNVLSISDPRSAGWVTTYRYNANNQLVEQKQPDADGNSNTAGAPVTQLFYDKLGRQVAVKDANGNILGKVYDAVGNLVQELNADGGTIRHAYNVFGEKVSTIDAMDRATSFTYDNVSRLLTTTHGVVNVYGVNTTFNVAQLVDTRAIVETNTWDQAGRKLSQTNGNGETIRYVYDLQGRVVNTIQPMGQSTKVAYDARGNKIAEVDGNGYIATWSYDYFGKVQAHTDFGGRAYAYTYDNARQLTFDSGANREYHYNSEGLLERVYDRTTTQDEKYEYDMAGNRVREWFAKGNVVYKDNHIAYDALGRMRWVADGRAYVNIEYDKVGNRTNIRTHVLNQDTSLDSNLFFQYDQMNRQTVANAADAQGNLGAEGHRITYDKNGNRVTDTWNGTRVMTVNGQSQIVGFDENGSAIYSTTPTSYVATLGETTEQYRYDALNRMTSVVRDGVQTDARLYDGASRVIQTGPAGSLPQAYINALNGTNLSGQTLAGTGSETHINRYNANGQIVRQDVYKSDNTPKYAVVYDALPAPLKPGMGTAGGYDSAGNLLGYTVFDWAGGNVTNYANTYGRAEGYRQLTTLGTSTVTNPGGTVWEYGNGGELTAVNDVTKPLDNRSFVSDISGTIVYAEQAGQGQHQLVVNGQVLGRYGSIRDENNPTLPNGTPFFLPKAEFNFGYQPINGNYPSASPGTYAVSAGDTLQGIARGAYGDESLWYLIADANGLGSNADLKAGQVLTIPTKVGGANNANSFKPYDPSRTIGDTNPNMAMPQADKGGGCGGIGQILVIVVAVVAAVFTAGAAAVAMAGVEAGVGAGVALADAGLAGIMSAGGAAMAGGVAAGAAGMGGAVALSGIGAGAAMGAAVIGGAVGSIVSQGVGIAIGAQDEFSWKGVALGALGAGVSAGVGGYFGPVGPSVQGMDRVAAFAGRAALSSAITQGISVATGLQSSFSWRGVAASAVGAGVAQGVTAGVNELTGYDPQAGFNFGKGLLAGSLAGLAGGLTTAAMRGGRVSAAQVATDAFGNALGSSVAEAFGQYVPPANGASGASSATASSDDIVVSQAVAYGEDMDAGQMQKVGWIDDVLGVPRPSKDMFLKSSDSFAEWANFNKGLAGLLQGEESNGLLLDIAQDIRANKENSPFVKLFSGSHVYDMSDEQWIGARDSLLGRLQQNADISNAISYGLQRNAGIQSDSISDQTISTFNRLKISDPELAYIADWATSDGQSLRQITVDPRRSRVPSLLIGAGAISEIGAFQGESAGNFAHAPVWELAASRNPLGAAMLGIVGTLPTMSSISDTAKQVSTIKELIKAGSGLENPLIQKALDLGLEATYKGINKTLSISFLSKTVKNFFGNVGEYGELVAYGFLKSSQLFSDLAILQNNSKQGLDAIGKAATGIHAGQWTPLEIKTSADGTAPKLSIDQSKGSAVYTALQLVKLTSGLARYRPGISIDQVTYTKALSIQNDISVNRLAPGYLISGSRVLTAKPDVTIRRW